MLQLNLRTNNSAMGWVYMKSFSFLPSWSLWDREIALGPRNISRCLQWGRVGIFSIWESGLLSKPWGTYDWVRFFITLTGPSRQEKQTSDCIDLGSYFSYNRNLLQSPQSSLAHGVPHLTPCGKGPLLISFRKCDNFPPSSLTLGLLSCGEKLRGTMRESSDLTPSLALLPQRGELHRLGS